MDEGKRLSIKQSNMEGTVKKLKAQLKKLEASHTQAAAEPINPGVHIHISLSSSVQVMEEGERLSIKQSNMEGTIKKLRAQLK